MNFSLTYREIASSLYRQAGKQAVEFYHGARNTDDLVPNLPRDYSRLRWNARWNVYRFGPLLYRKL